MGILDTIKEFARGKDPESDQPQPWQRSITNWLFQTQVKQPIKNLGSGIQSGLSKIVIFAIVILIIILVGNRIITKHV